MSLPSVLVVDDDLECIRTMRRLLGAHYRVVSETSAEGALELLLHGVEFDVVLCDLRMDGWSGLDLYKRLEHHGNPHTARFVMLSGEDVCERHPTFAAALGARLLQKPVDPVRLLAILSTVRAEAKRAAPTVLVSSAAQ